MATATKNRVAVPETNGDGAIVLRLRKLEDAVLRINIEGKTPLIPHKWSEKALRLMREKQFGNKVREAKPPKNPEEDAHQSCYWFAEGVPGMPATAFKAAIVDATRFFEGVTAVMARQLFYVVGDGPDQLVRIDGKPEIFEGTPRNSGGTVDLRYRMRIFPWKATLVVSWVQGQIDPESVLALVDAAGRGGVGDWRPSSPKSKTGTFGTWRVVLGK